MSTPLDQLDAAELARRRTRREVIAEAVLRAFMQRIDEREAVVRAWAYLDRDAALAAAQALDRGAVRGPLHGFPIGVKDVYDTFDMPTAYGSPIHEGHRPTTDAASVALSRRAGAIIVGKTVTTEFATFPPGPTTNPRNPAHTPGGWSSGSAAAVGAGMVPVAFGTRTTGSIIRPAAFCGTVGYKPTFGTLSPIGVKAVTWSFDTVGVLTRGAHAGCSRGVLTRSVADAAFFVGTLSGRTGLHVNEIPPAPRIGICLTARWPMALPETQALFEQLPARLAARGARVERACRVQVDEALGGCDVLVVPSAPGEAPRGIDATGDPVFNRTWSLLHTPAIHVPAGQGPSGLPLGVQIVGRIGDDARALACAARVERALN